MENKLEKLVDNCSKNVLNVAVASFGTGIILIGAGQDFLHQHYLSAIWDSSLAGFTAYLSYNSYKKYKKTMKAIEESFPKD